MNEQDGAERSAATDVEQPVETPPDFTDAGRFTKSDAEDIAEMEALLGVRSGALKGLDFYVETIRCEECDRLLGGSDVVYTALRDGGHSKAFLLYGLLTTEKASNPPRLLRCRKCGRPRIVLGVYGSLGGYNCNP